MSKSRHVFSGENLKERPRPLDPAELALGDREALWKLGMLTLEAALADDAYVGSNGVFVRKLGAETLAQLDAAAAAWENHPR